MSLARNVFEGTFYFITCAPSLDAARRACVVQPKRAGWGLRPSPRSTDRRQLNPHFCTCRDKGERLSCRHYQFESPSLAPKP